MTGVMNESVEFQVGAEARAQRLDEFLAARLGQLSRLRIAGLLEQGACKVNGRTAHAGRQVRSGDVVELLIMKHVPGAMTPEALKLETLYEDDDLLVVVKPAGMLVHPTRGVKSGTLANALAYYLNRSLIAETDARRDELKNDQSVKYEAPISDDESPSRNLKSNIAKMEEVVRPGIVHRLDRATSGLMVVAKNQRALSILSRHFHHRLVEKRYLAVVSGHVSKDELLITPPIGRDPAGAQPHWRVMDNGKPAETRLRVVRRRSQRTLVELEPVTGRTNQLRIHCAHVGHPIIGDEWYGAANAGARLCLHAARLAFHHPSGGRWMEFESPLPFEIEEMINAE
jgi:23S rRNA pseudouridine1911/1915/1917 synthase